MGTVELESECHTMLTTQGELKNRGGQSMKYEHTILDPRETTMDYNFLC